MADKHSLNYDVRELKLGTSFTNNKASQYHTIKYDFKPASVDMNKMATVDVGTNNQVTVTVPHLDGAGVPQTVFKGSQRPYTKECVLIIDRVTGEITLEKLSSNIQVKKTRQETTQKPRPLTPVTTDFTNTTQRSTSRTRVATNRRTTNNANPAGAAQPNVQSRFNNTTTQKPAQNMVRSPPRVKTSPPQAPWSAGGNSTLASLPMIGLDDAPTARSPGPAARVSHAAHAAHAPHGAHAAHAAHAPHAAHTAHAAHATHAAHAAHPPPQHSMPHMHAPPPRPRQRLLRHQRQHRSRRRMTARPARQVTATVTAEVAATATTTTTTHLPLCQHYRRCQHSPTAQPTRRSPSDVLNDDLCLSESGSDSD